MYANKNSLKRENGNTNHIENCLKAARREEL
jgi:hypothetical protein